MQLKLLEARLLEHDPAFTEDDTADRRSLRKHYLLNAFVRGLAPTDPLSDYDPESVEQASQLHLNVERIRVPEVIHQPHMAGLDCAGLLELVENALRHFTLEERNRLTKVCLSWALREASSSGYC
jgi:actin-related protein 5